MTATIRLSSPTRRRCRSIRTVNVFPLPHIMRSTDACDRADGRTATPLGRPGTPSVWSRRQFRRSESISNRASAISLFRSAPHARHRSGRRVPIRCKTCRLDPAMPGMLYPPSHRLAPMSTRCRVGELVQPRAFVTENIGSARCACGWACLHMQRASLRADRPITPHPEFPQAPPRRNTCRHRCSSDRRSCSRARGWADRSPSTDRTSRSTLTWTASPSASTARSIARIPASLYEHHSVVVFIPLTLMFAGRRSPAGCSPSETTPPSSATRSATARTWTAS